MRKGKQSKIHRSVQAGRHLWRNQSKSKPLSICLPGPLGQWISLENTCRRTCSLHAV